MGRTEIDELEMQLDDALDYKQWKSIATELDAARGYDSWSLKPSRLFDQALIRKRTNILSLLKKGKSFSAIAHHLRSGLIRNYAGIAETRLYRKYYLGTKAVIHEYLDQLCSLFEYITNSQFEPSITVKEKCDLLSDQIQNFGQTALILQGGSTFGLVHIGVCKVLHENDILPRIVSGQSVGALIAALVCTHTDEELRGILSGESINLEAFSKRPARGNIQRKFARFLKYGYFLDVKVIEDLVRQNLGDETFAEAYHRTGRVLNIDVASTRKFEIPRGLNYLTAPDVLIWSAAVASCSSMGLYASVILLAKNEIGDVVRWSNKDIKFKDANIYDDADVVQNRLSQLFNANHFIFSQATPYIAPFLSRGPQFMSRGWLGKWMTFVSTELRHRLAQLAYLKVVPDSLLTLLDQRSKGVVITPPLISGDFYTLFNNPTAQSMDYWILKGERATWPFLTLLKNRMIVEVTMEREWNLLRLQKEKKEAKRRVTERSPRLQKRRTLI